MVPGTGWLVKTGRRRAPPRYGGRVRTRIPRLGLLLLVLASVVVAGWIRTLRRERAPRRALDGGPVRGSLDTWPSVPRAPGRQAEAPPG
jgi:hypothetical protein